MYKDQKDIPDQEVVEQFAASTEIKFLAKNFNCVKYRYVSFGNLGWWIPLQRVLPLINVTPTALRPVFMYQTTFEKRWFPFSFSWFGLNKRTYRSDPIELPLVIKTYDELGAFVRCQAAFKELAKVLGKTVRVFEECGSTGECVEHFSVLANGEVVEVK